MAGKILIVEDNSRFAEILAILLNEAGDETSLAKNSGREISKALTERPDLILTDYAPRRIELRLDEVQRGKQY